MKFEEAIETLSHKEMAKFTDHEGLSYKEYVEYKKYRKKIDEVIILLKHGKAFEKMWKASDNLFHMNKEELEYMREWIKNKYFPKEN